MIRSELDVLLDKVQDSALRADLQSQIDPTSCEHSTGEAPKSYQGSAHARVAATVTSTIEA